MIYARVHAETPYILVARDEVQLQTHLPRSQSYTLVDRREQVVLQNELEDTHTETLETFTEGMPENNLPTVLPVYQLEP